MKFFQVSTSSGTPIATPVLPTYASFVSRQLNAINITRECPVSQKAAINLFDNFEDPVVYDKPLNALFPTKVPIGSPTEWVRESSSDFKTNVNWYKGTLYQELLGDDPVLFRYVFDEQKPRDLTPKRSMYAILEMARYKYYQLYLKEKMSLQTYRALKKTIGKLTKADLEDIKKKITKHPSMRDKIITHREKELQKQFFNNLTIKTDLSFAKTVISETRYILRKMFEKNPDDRKLFLAFAEQAKKLVIIMGENRQTEKAINYSREKDEIFIAMLPPPMENSRLIFPVARGIFENHLRQAMIMRFYSLSDYFQIKLLEEKSRYLDSKEIIEKFLDQEQLPLSQVFLIRSDEWRPPTCMLEVGGPSVNTGLALASREAEGEGHGVYLFLLGGRTYESKGGTNNRLIVVLPKNSKTAEMHDIYIKTLNGVEDSLSDKLFNTYAYIFQESLKIWYTGYKDASNFGRELTKLLAGFGSKTAEFFGSGVMELYRNNLNNIYYRFGLNVEPPSLSSKKVVTENYVWTAFKTLMNDLSDFVNIIAVPPSEEEVSSYIQEDIRISMK